MKNSKNFCIFSESMYNNDSEWTPFLKPYCQAYGKDNNGNITCKLCRSDKIITTQGECI